MNFFEKYSLFYETISKTNKRNKIKLTFKFFETPVRKMLQLTAYSLINNTADASIQPFNIKKNLITVTEKFFFCINVNKLSLVTHLKKNPSVPRKIKESITYKTYTYKDRNSEKNTVLPIKNIHDMEKNKLTLNKLKEIIVLENKINSKKILPSIKHNVLIGVNSVKYLEQISKQKVINDTLQF
jgi:hypothetical protein